jgi:hypothetical protein
MCVRPNIDALIAKPETITNIYDEYGLLVPKPSVGAFLGLALSQSHISKLKILISSFNKS